MGITAVTNGNWVSSVEQRFNQSNVIFTRQGDTVLVPLQQGRHLHTFGFEFRDSRHLSQLNFRVRQHYWLNGKPWGSTISVQEFFQLGRQLYQSWTGQWIDDRGLVEWAVSQNLLESDNGNAKIINGVYMDVDISDANGNVIHNWKKKFVDPNIFSPSSEEDYIWDSIPVDGLDVQPGWHMCFRPVFSNPADGPTLDNIPLWNFKGYYYPENSQNVEIRNKNNGWYQPVNGIELPASLVGKQMVAAMLELHDNHGGASVFLHNGNNVPLTHYEDIKGDRKIMGERQMFAFNQPWTITNGQRLYVGGASFGMGKGQIEIREIDLFIHTSQPGPTAPPIPGPGTGVPGPSTPSLPVLGSIRVDNPDNHERYVRLCQGDLFADYAEYVVISVYPGSYGGGLAGLLANKGINVQQLSQNPAFDLRPFGLPVWISQPINNPGFKGRNLVVFEPGFNDPDEILSHIDDIFEVIQFYKKQENLTTPESVNMPMVCTGRGVDYAMVTRMLACKALLFTGLKSFPLKSVNIINYSFSSQNIAFKTFNDVKSNYDRLASLQLPSPMPGTSFKSSHDNAISIINSRGLTEPTRKQAYAITLYTSNYYGAINKPMRINAAQPKPDLTNPDYIMLQPYYALLTSALMNMVDIQKYNYKGLVHRGASFLPPYVINGYSSTNQPFVNYGFTSCSRLEAVAKGFSGGKNMLHIEAYSGADIDQHSVFLAEAEVLFPKVHTLTTFIGHSGQFEKEFSMKQYWGAVD